MHDLDYVKRYSWFDPNANNEKYPKLQTSDIINENNQLTTLGEFYASQNPNNNLSNYNQKLSELTIYPNPTKNLIFIDEIDLSQLKKGVYIIKLSDKKNKSVHKSIVKI